MKAAVVEILIIIVLAINLLAGLLRRYFENRLKIK